LGDKIRLKCLQLIFVVLINLELKSFADELNNITKYSLTHLFIKYLMNLQLSVTRFLFLEPFSGLI